MAAAEPYGRDLSDMFNYSDAVRKALNDIVIILPQPVLVATTKRLSGIFTFKADLVNYTVSVDYAAVFIAYYAYCCFVLIAYSCVRYLIVATIFMRRFLLPYFMSHICSCQKGPDPMDERSPWVGIVRTFE